GPEPMMMTLRGWLDWLVSLMRVALPAVTSGRIGSRSISTDRRTALFRGGSGSRGRDDRGPRRRPIAAEVEQGALALLPHCPEHQHARVVLVEHLEDLVSAAYVRRLAAQPGEVAPGAGDRPQGPQGHHVRLEGRGT